MIEMLPEENYEQIFNELKEYFRQKEGNEKLSESIKRVKRELESLETRFRFYGDGK